MKIIGEIIECGNPIHAMVLQKFSRFWVRHNRRSSLRRSVREFLELMSEVLLLLFEEMSSGSNNPSFRDT
jgi:hypothetical protein